MPADPLEEVDVDALLVSLGVLIAVSAAIRSTWSPCGLSMLSTITPVGEASRQRRYGVSASWFVVGALLGGATTGLLAVVAALVVGALNLSSTTALALGALAACAAALVDGGIVVPPPHHRRQVNETWLNEFRSWVYGTGFGWQIGTGILTYIMTAGVYLTLVLGALTGRPLVAFGLAVLFGGVRGLAVWATARLRTREQLLDFHRRFEAAGLPARRAIVVVEVAVATVAAVAVSPLAAVGVAVASAAVAATRMRSATPRNRVVQAEAPIERGVAQVEAPTGAMSRSRYVSSGT